MQTPTTTHADTQKLATTPPWRVRYNQRDWSHTGAEKHSSVQPIGTRLAGQASSLHHMREEGDDEEICKYG